MPVQKSQSWLLEELIVICCVGNNSKRLCVTIAWLLCAWWYLRGGPLLLHYIRLNNSARIRTSRWDITSITLSLPSQDWFCINIWWLELAWVKWKVMSGPVMSAYRIIPSSLGNLAREFSSVVHNLYNYREDTRSPETKSVFLRGVFRILKDPDGSFLQTTSGEGLVTRYTPTCRSHDSFLLQQITTSFVVKFSKCFNWLTLFIMMFCGGTVRNTSTAF